MTAPTLDPIAVYDIRDADAWTRITDNATHHQQLLAWMRSQGMEPNNTYRIEIYLIDCPSARIYEYELNSDGRRFIVDNEIVRREPHDVILSSLPPA